MKTRKYLCILEVVDEIPSRDDFLWISKARSLFRDVCEFAIVGQNPPIVPGVLLVANGTRCLWSSLGRDYDAVIAIDSAATFDASFSPEELLAVFDCHRPLIATAGNETELQKELDSYGFFVVSPEFLLWYCTQLTNGIGLWAPAPDGHFNTFGRAISTLWNRNLGKVWCALAASFSKDGRPPCLSIAARGVCHYLHGFLATGSKKSGVHGRAS